MGTSFLIRENSTERVRVLDDGRLVFERLRHGSVTSRAVMTADEMDAIDAAREGRDA